MSGELPLLDLFMRLRQADMPLGIDEYRILLRALQLGFGDDRAALRRVCSALWVKSREDRYLFDYHFDRLLKEWDSADGPILPTISPQPTDISVTPSPTGTIPPQAETQPSSPALPVETPTSPERHQARAAETQQQASEPAEQDQERLRAIQEQLSTREIPLKRFVLSGEFMPVTPREMKQKWRYLRRMVRDGAATELDVAETVREIGRNGIMLAPVLVPPRVNRTELLLLVDQGGSMVPFHALSRHFVGTAVRGGRLGRAGVYYFHNVPVRNVYGTPALLEPHLLKSLLANLRRDRTVVLVFSDAGAARGNLNSKRAAQTQAFLEQLQSKVRHVAWLNPMPRERWDATTAAYIAPFVPMFEFTRHGMDQAVDALRGRYVVLTGR